MVIEPNIILSIIVYILIAITGMNNIRFGFMCRSTSAVLILTNFTYLNKYFQRITWLNIGPITMIIPYMYKSLESLTNKKTIIRLAILIMVFLATVNLNASIPKKNQLMSIAFENKYII